LRGPPIPRHIEKEGESQGGRQGTWGCAKERKEERDGVKERATPCVACVAFKLRARVRRIEGEKVSKRKRDNKKRDNKVEQASVCVRVYV